MIFFDTNIFIYSISAAAEDARNHAIACGLLATEDFALSVQVIQEFIDVTQRKKRLGVSDTAIRAAVDQLLGYPLAETSVSLVLAAMGIRERYGIRYWDAAILAAATELGCTRLYSEDFSHGQFYGTVQVINPFS